MQDQIKTLIACSCLYSGKANKMKENNARQLSYSNKNSVIVITYVFLDIRLTFLHFCMKMNKSFNFVICFRTK